MPPTNPNPAALAWQAQVDALKGTPDDPNAKKGFEPWELSQIAKQEAQKALEDPIDPNLDIENFDCRVSWVHENTIPPHPGYIKDDRQVRPKGMYPCMKFGLEMAGEEGRALQPKARFNLMKSGVEVVAYCRVHERELEEEAKARREAAEAARAKTSRGGRQHSARRGSGERSH